ncbi:DEAD/DEAH box helicase [Caproicibacter fermentans]|uniref:DEAD/DEAH box helicase family protein n=1 Tax=Caproicibacter fermentans TaxID=2576756 RepID=A0A7G8T8L5_9FIRM|nr:DEAD/DEAH box helicase family protein [Caproicibacter fermentans]QNK39956.1 DEAD/DEAH box helicase family protein [Caproicibacter fermentans]
MRMSLFDFQEDAKAELIKKIGAAHNLLSMNQGQQIITFSAPTGAGKTIIMTSLFEDILFGTADIDAQPDAIFVWLSDMPELNEQSKLKVEAKSDMIQSRRLITIDSNYDSECLDPGNVYFLNTQKLGNDKLLTQKSDTRQYTIWETLTNTAAKYQQQLYVVIDEAHRGMNISTRAENIARSIMQKFIVGSEADGLCVMPLIIGVSATPQRFQRMIAETNSTKHSVSVRPEDVIESGLLKDRVIIHCPEMAFNAEMTLFQEAVSTWKSMSVEWSTYCASERERLVKPILVVQVNDRTDSVATTTDINTCLETLADELGRSLEIGEVVHTFNDEGTLNGFSIPIVKIEPSRIEENEKAILVFFKMNLSTGWDCPRAEVMMSFRSAQDYTYIAQLLGRMVRTPLAHRIEMNAALNAVHLFLPFFDQSTVSDVVQALKEDENAAPTETGIAPELVTLSRNPAFEEVFNHMQDLVTYRVEGVRKETNLRRLDKIRAFLAVDGVNASTDRSIRQKMSQKVREELEVIKLSQNYDKLVSGVTGMNLKTLEVEIATNQIVADHAQSVSVLNADKEAIFKTAEKRIGDYIATQYRVENREKDDSEAKIELIVVASNVSAMDNLEDYAGKLFDETYNENRRAIQMLRTADREKYDHLVSSGRNATPLQWRAPFSISFNCSENSAEYDRHLFINETGNCRVTLNAWEDGVLKEEMHRADFVAWLRNLDRKNWSIEIPYKVSGVYKAMFPDMMIVRKDAHGYIFDILEPHDSSRSDNCAKAKGLAEFAQAHFVVYGRIELIRKLSGTDGASHFYRLNLTNITIQREVLAISTNEDLDRIFDTHATTDN